MYVPETFSDQVYERINEGALVVAYVGHGNADGFADLEWGDDTFPILDTDDLGQIDLRTRSPILSFVACSTGAFDQGDSVSERILLSDGGPAVVLSSTEISHPVPNAFFAYELSRGPVMRRARFDSGGRVGMTRLEACPPQDENAWQIRRTRLFSGHGEKGRARRVAVCGAEGSA